MKKVLEIAIGGLLASVAVAALAIKILYSKRGIRWMVKKATLLQEIIDSNEEETED